MRRQLERQEQQNLFQWLEINKKKYPALELCFHIPNGGSRNIIEARNLKLSGVKAGVPDLFLAYPKSGSQWPHGPGAHGLFIEIKSAKGKPSANQEKWVSMLRDAGYQAEFCYSWTAAVSVIVDYLGLPLRLKV